MYKKTNKKTTKEVDKQLKLNGLPHLLWIEVLDKYSKERVIDVNLYEQMDEKQVFMIQELKKQNKRFKYERNR